MPKWVYPLAFAFVLFLIYNDPSGSGDTAGNFAGFIVDLLGAVGQFLTGLFEGTADAGANPSPSPTSTSVVDSATSGVDTFTHDHGGTATTHVHTSSTVAGG